MSCYTHLAGCYDALTCDVAYSDWADFCETLFRRRGLPGRTVLDLACGTGSLTWELAARGWEMIGVDRSPEMLAQAAGKSRPVPVPPLFLCQSMERLDLYGTVDACVCSLDSVNYVTDPKKLRRAFDRVELFLAPGGLFLFDVNAPEALEKMDGQVFLDETEDCFCVWRGAYSRRSRICSWYMDLFLLDKETGRWERREELHRERAYTAGELTDMLLRAGFEQVQVYGNRKLRPPRPGEERLFLAARKGDAPCGTK